MAAHADTENFDWKDATEDEAAADKTSDLTAAMHFAQVENDARRSRKRVVVGVAAAIVVIAAVAFGVHLLMSGASVAKSHDHGSAATRTVEPAEGSEADETTAADPVNLVAEGEEEGANASASGVRLSCLGERGQALERGRQRPARPERRQVRDDFCRGRAGSGGRGIRCGYG